VRNFAIDKNAAVCGTTAETRDRLEDLRESEGWRTLEGGSQRWNLRRVTEGKDRAQRQQAEWDEQANKECGQQRHPGGSVSSLAVGNEQREHSDSDGCDCYPEPGSLLVK
jgi:hypothetical protein